MLAEEQCVLSGEQALQVHTRHLEPSLTTGKAKKRARRPAGEQMEDSDEVSPPNSPPPEGLRKWKILTNDCKSLDQSDSDPSPVKIPQVTPRPTENVYEVPYRTKKPRRRHAEVRTFENMKFFVLISRVTLIIAAHRMREASEGQISKFKSFENHPNWRLFVTVTGRSLLRNQPVTTREKSTRTPTICSKNFRMTAKMILELSWGPTETEPVSVKLFKH